MDGWWNCKIIMQTSELLVNWLTDWLIDDDWLTDSLIYRLTYCCTDRLIDYHNKITDWQTDKQTDYELTHKPKITRLCYTKYVFALTILQNLSLWHMYLGQLLLCSTWMTFENSFLHQCLDYKMHQVTWELAHHLNESGPLYSFKTREAFHPKITPIPKHWRYNPAHTLSQATLSLSLSQTDLHIS